MNQALVLNMFLSWELCLTISNITTWIADDKQFVYEHPENGNKIIILYPQLTLGDLIEVMKQSQILNPYISRSPLSK